MKKRKLDNIQLALSYSPFSDYDKDGVPNILDCKPFDPQKDGFFRDLGGAVRTRVKGEIGVTKTRILKGVAGEEAREQREAVRKAESEGYYEEIKKQVKERGREKARAKFAKREPIGRKLEKTVEVIEKFAQRKQKKRRKVGLDGCPDVSLQLLGTIPSKKTKKAKKKITGTLNVVMPDVKW